MPDRTRLRIPKYRHQKSRGLAVVRIDGRDIYLGPYDSPESHEKYHRVIAEWMAAGGRPTSAGRPGPDEADSPTVNNVILAFLTRHADQHYRRADGTPTGEYHNFIDSLKPIKKLYGRTPARDFSPKRLKAVRQEMIDSGLTRGVINQRVGRIVHAFKWAFSEEMIPPDVHHGLKAVSPRLWDRTKSAAEWHLDDKVMES